MNLHIPFGTRIRSEWPAVGPLPENGRGERARTSSALKLLFPKQVGYHLPIYTPMKLWWTRTDLNRHRARLQHAALHWSYESELVDVSCRLRCHLATYSVYLVEMRGIEPPILGCRPSVFPLALHPHKLYRRVSATPSPRGVGFEPTFPVVPHPAN